jgi:hypothetical protein
MALEKKHLATIGLWGSKREEYKALIDKHGMDDVDKAMAAAITDGGLEDVKSKPAVVLHRMAQKLAELIGKRDTAVLRRKQEARQAEFVEQQIAYDSVRGVLVRLPHYTTLFNARSRKFMASLQGSTLEHFCYKLTARQRQRATALARAVEKRRVKRAEKEVLDFYSEP